MRKKLFPYVISISIILLYFLTTAFYTMVHGESMYPTYQDGEIITVFQVEKPDTIQRNDIILFQTDQSKEYYIKRIIGLPGETIMVEEDGIYVDGVYLEQQKGIAEKIAERTYPYELGEEEYFVIGDNRTNSFDSRAYDFGKVLKQNILCKIKSEK